MSELDRNHSAAASADAWRRFQKWLCVADSIGLSLDAAGMNAGDDFLNRMKPLMADALAAMNALEAGEIANPDENRMVGHYWLRAPARAPTAAIRTEIENTRRAVADFVAEVHAGRIRPPKAKRFTRVLSIGIGGSALGPMFVHDALRDPNRDQMSMHFLDNTDPDGIARVFAELGEDVAETLCLVISKSGGTPETRNGMLHAVEAYRAAGLNLAKHAVAVTGANSTLDREATSHGWLARFPMWDWVGGRTSLFSAVGLLPASLQGIDIDAMLAGAAAADEVTRIGDAMRNPAALMALMWHHAASGRGAKDLVVLPYRDRLLLFSRYLQQLIMESLGKRLNTRGEVVEQGLTVYGNKGSTDQHAYVQQLRDGVDNFFVTFIRVLEDGGQPLEVEPGVTSGDYLHGFLLGTREALRERGRQSMTLTIDRIDARAVGVLVALFERAVGLYASLVGINAYDQPGVEAGKKAAAVVLDLQRRIIAALSDHPQTTSEITHRTNSHDIESACLVLEHLAANGRARRLSGGYSTDHTWVRAC